MTEKALHERGFFSQHLWPGLLLPPLLALIVHWPALSDVLFWDDGLLITTHPRIADRNFLTEIFSRDYGVELQPNSPLGFYRPLLMVLNYGLFHCFGPSAFAYHAVVLLTFCFSCFLLAAVSSRALPDRPAWLAPAVGCVAAVHPVRTEFAVFFMSMPDLLVEIFTLLIIVTCLGLFRSISLHSRVLLASGLALAAGLTKEVSFFVVGALAATRLLAGIDSRNRRASFFEGFGLLGGLAVAFVLRLAAGIPLPASKAPWTSLLAGAEQASNGLMEGVGNLIVPAPTVFMAAEQDFIGAGFAVFAAAAIVFAAVLVIRLTLQGRLFEAMVGAWFSAGFLCLMLLRVQGYPYSDRYLPSGAAIIVMVLVLSRLWEMGPTRSAWWRWLSATCFVTLLVVQASISRTSTAQCDGRDRFFEVMADRSPNLYYPRVVLANFALLRAHSLELGGKYMNQAIALAPDEPHVRMMGKSLAIYYITEGDFRGALGALDWSAEVLTSDAELWSLRAICQSKLLDYADAYNSARRALSLSPDNPFYQKQVEEISAAATEE